MSPEAPLAFPTVARWRQWLRKNHGRDAGTWVLLARKGAPPGGASGIGYREVLEEALCWGWIDGKIHRVDERCFAQWFSPRRPRSLWSLPNRRTVERLAREGRMQPAGLARVAEAKRNGRWTAAYGPASAPRLDAEVPRALKAAGAWAAWQATPPSRQRMLQYWVGDAKRPETRARRLAELPTLVKEGRLAGFAAP